MLFLVNEAMVELSVGTAGLVALLGYLVVFLGLVALMFVIIIMGKIMTGKKKASAPAATAATAAPAPVKNVPAAPGTAGEIKLHTVSDRDAAILMAIVANKLGKPLNELRFKSIKEVSDK